LKKKNPQTNQNTKLKHLKNQTDVPLSVQKGS